MLQTYNELLSEIQKLVDAGFGDVKCASYIIDTNDAKYYIDTDERENLTKEQIERLTDDLSDHPSVWEKLEEIAHNNWEMYKEEQNK